MGQWKAPCSTYGGTVSDFNPFGGRYITHVTTFTLDYTPAQFLLHHMSLAKKDYYKSLAMYMVNAARLCIPKHWHSICTPTIREWLARVSKINKGHGGIDPYFTRKNAYIFNHLGMLDPFHNNRPVLSVCSLELIGGQRNWPWGTLGRMVGGWRADPHTDVQYSLPLP